VIIESPAEVPSWSGFFFLSNHMGLSNRLWEENDACMVRAAGRRASAAGHRRGRRGVVALTAADSLVAASEAAIGYEGCLAHRYLRLIIEGKFRVYSERLGTHVNRPGSLVGQKSLQTETGQQQHRQKHEHSCRQRKIKDFASQT
jgi:hypothetical protein